MDQVTLTELFREQAEQASESDGLLFVSRDLPVDAVMAAYAAGVFPWPAEDDVVGWFCPPERYVIPAGGVRINRSTRKALRQARFEIRLDTCFDAVVDCCARAPRPQGSGTWITDAVRATYAALHRAGYAHSVEVYQHGALVGGLYGVAYGALFFGESMFHAAPNAAKAAVIALSVWLERHGFALIDCQVETPHMVALGAQPMPRAAFLDHVKAQETHHGPGWRSSRWAFDVDDAAALPWRHGPSAAPLACVAG